MNREELLAEARRETELLTERIYHADRVVTRLERELMEAQGELKQAKQAHKTFTEMVYQLTEMPTDELKRERDDLLTLLQKARKIIGQNIHPDCIEQGKEQPCEVCRTIQVIDFKLFQRSPHDRTDVEG